MSHLRPVESSASIRTAATASSGVRKIFSTSSHVRFPRPAMPARTLKPAFSRPCQISRKNVRIPPGVAQAGKMRPPPGGAASAKSGSEPALPVAGGRQSRDGYFLLGSSPWRG
jgi:hypothetical protein